MATQVKIGLAHMFFVIANYKDMFRGILKG